MSTSVRSESVAPLKGPLHPPVWLQWPGDACALKERLLVVWGFGTPPAGGLCGDHERALHSPYTGKYDLRFSLLSKISDASGELAEPPSWKTPAIGAV